MCERQCCSRRVDARGGDDCLQQLAEQCVGLDCIAIEHDGGGVTESPLELPCSASRLGGEHLFGVRAHDEAVVSERDGRGDLVGRARRGGLDGEGHQCAEVDSESVANVDVAHSLHGTSSTWVCEPGGFPDLG